MKLRHVTVIILAAVFAACSDQTNLTEDNLRPPTTANDAVKFDTYMGRVNVTRGGSPGAINTAQLKDPNYGFGVFAYKTGTGLYNGFRTQDAVTERYPNFMYNEPIKWDGTTWAYAHASNIKYWPNEVGSGSVDDQNNDSGNDPATTDYVNGGKVSFFAYAPYTLEGTKASTADIEGQPVATSDNEGTNYGIIAFSTPLFNGGKSDATKVAERYRYSDPYVKYRLSPNGSVVDLLWATTTGSGENVLSQGTQLGVASESYADYDNSGVQIANDYTTPTPSIVRPAFNVAADLTKQKTNGTVNFLFKHALAKIGGSFVGGSSGVDGSDEDGTTPTSGLMVILDIDKDGAEFGNSLFPYAEGPTATTPYNTKVTINRIVLESEKQLTAAGVNAIQTNSTFNYNDATYTEPLHNTGIFNLVTGLWSNIEYSSPTSAATEPRVNTIVPATGNSTVDDAQDAILNHNIAEPDGFTDLPRANRTKEGFESLPIGVTTVAKNVYEGEVQPFVFLPGTFPIITITVDYTVRTYDAKLANNYTEVRQRITKRLYILEEIVLNKQYNILMHLGLTSVKFDATVDDWDDTTATPSTPTTPVPGGSSVTTYDGDEVEHVYLPINVSDFASMTPATISNFTDAGGSTDIGIITVTFANGDVHTSQESDMQFTLSPATAGASVTVDTDSASPTYGHVTITLPANTTAAAIDYTLTIRYGVASKTISFSQDPYTP